MGGARAHCYHEVRMPQVTPTVVIVGRPNVGKSTLFNRITGERRAIVGDEPGITRDRMHGRRDGITAGRFEIIDTGGIVVHDDEYIPSQDSEAGASGVRKRPRTSFFCRWARGDHGSRPRPGADAARFGKPVTWRSTRSTRWHARNLAHEFYGAGDSRRVSGIGGARNRGADLLDHVTAEFGRQEPEAGEEAEESPRRIKVAIIGRPNVGKSTLLNALTGAERAIVSPVAGTTRDAVDETVGAGRRRTTCSSIRRASGARARRS